MIDDDMYYSDDESVCIGLTFHHPGGAGETSDYDNTKYNEVATQSTNSTDSGVECPKVITIDPNHLERETDSGCDDKPIDLTTFLASDHAQPDQATYSYGSNVSKKKLLGGVSGQSVGFLSPRSMHVLNGKLATCNINNINNSRVYTKGRISPEGLTSDIEEEKTEEKEEERKMSRKDRIGGREKGGIDQMKEGKREERKAGRREERKRRCDKVPSTETSSNGSETKEIMTRRGSYRASGSYENVPSYENLPKRNPVYVNCKPPKFLMETPRIADMSVVECGKIDATSTVKQKSHKDNSGLMREERLMRRHFYSESVEYNTPVRRNYIAKPRKLSPHHYEKIDSPDNTLSPGEIPSDLIKQPITSVFNPGYVSSRITGDRCLGHENVYVGQSKYSVRQHFRHRYTPSHTVSTPNLVPPHMATREHYDFSNRTANNVHHGNPHLPPAHDNQLMSPSNHLATSNSHLATSNNQLTSHSNYTASHNSHLATPNKHLATTSKLLGTPINHLATPSRNRDRHNSRDKMMYLDNPIYGISEEDQYDTGKLYKCYRCQAAMNKEEKFRGDMDNVYCSKCRNTVRFKRNHERKRIRTTDKEYTTPSPDTKYRPGTPYHLFHTSVNIAGERRTYCNSTGDDMSADGSSSPELQQKGVVLLQATKEDINSLRNVDDKIVELRFVDSGLTEEILHLLSLLCKEKDIHRIMLDDCEVEDWVVFCNVIRQTNITHLSINKSKVGDEGSVRISHLLNAAPSLCSLELTKCKIKCAGIAALGVALMQNKTLLNLDLSGNDFKKNGAVLFFRALKSGNSTIQHLSLHHTCVGTTDVVLMIAALLLRNSGLSALHLGYTDMTDDGVGLLAESLAHNTTLNSLGLAGNDLSDASAHEMAVTLADSSTIKSVDFSNNILSSRGLNVLIQSITVRKSVSQLLLSSNDVTERETEDLRRLTEDLAMCDVVII